MSDNKPTSPAPVNVNMSKTSSPTSPRPRW